MGIGRRGFLKLTAIALAGIAVDPLQAVVTNKNAYINRKLGILFYKPNDWTFLGVQDFGKLKEQQILDEPYDHIKEEVWQDIGEPIVLATKYDPSLPAHDGKFSPTITLQVTEKQELDFLETRNFQVVRELSAQGAGALLKDFKVLKEYPPYQISNCNFYEYDAEYLFEHMELEKPLRVQLKCIKAEHENFYYDFNCHQCAESNETAHHEFQQFKKSIKLI